MPKPTAPLQPPASHRPALIARLAEPTSYDLVIIGGGATGLGVALDAALRGFSVVLVESHDFAKGTSSRATKLVHGGVRYLAQGNISLVREALHERATLLHNAPHIAQPLPFVMPSYKLWEAPFYGVGLKMYDALAGKSGLGPTEFLNRQETLQHLPTLQRAGLKGGVKYWDGQFDDARLALALARSAARQGALLINYCRANRLMHEDGKLVGLACQDQETGQSYTLSTRCVINATGVWVDELRQQDGMAMNAFQAKKAVSIAAIVAPSQGVHVVVDREFLPTDHAMLIPKTADGRVLFAVPWLGKTILGTTDTPRHDLAREPEPFKEEVEFILNESANYLSQAPTRADVKSVWVGLRPLVKPPEDEGDHTKKLSREHTVLVSSSGLVTVTGGKWTTYRAMAEDVLEQCFEADLLPARAAGVTVDFPLVGADAHLNTGSVTAWHSISAPQGLHSYGDEADLVAQLPGAHRYLTGRLNVGLTEAMVRFAARHEYARTVEDVLARRSRLLFLDAALASSLGAAVAQILQEETGVDPQLAAFLDLARHYQHLP